MIATVPRTPAEVCRVYLTNLGLALQATTTFSMCLLEPPLSPSPVLHVINPLAPHLVDNITCVLHNQKWWLARLSGDLIAPAHDLPPAVNAIHHALTHRTRPEHLPSAPG